MKQRILLAFFLLFSLQSLCMIISHNKGRNLLDDSKKELLSVMKCVVSNLDYKTNTRLIMTCRTLWYYMEKNNLPTPHYLNSNDYTKAMIHFARKNDTKKIEFLMQHEGPINKKNREEVLTYFGLNHGVDLQNIIEIYKRRYMTVMQVAICKEGKNTLNVLSMLNALYLTENSLMKKDICLVGLVNNPSALQLFLKQEYDPNIKGDNNDSLLHIAAVYNIDTLKILLAEPKLNPNIKNNDGLTALHCVVRGNNIDLLNHLFAKDRAGSAIDIDDISTVYCVSKEDERKILALLSASYHIGLNIGTDNIEFLYSVATENNIEALKLLMADKRVDPNIKSDSLGSTALHYSVIKNNIEALKLLLADKRVDLNIKSDKCGLTVLHYAVEKNNIEALKLLLADGRIDLNIKSDDGGLTALHYAVIKNNIKALKLLLTDFRVNPNVQDNRGFTIVHFAITYNAIDILKLLHDDKLEFEVSRETAFLIANRLEIKYPEVSKILLDRLDKSLKKDIKIISMGIILGIIGIALDAYFHK